MQLSSQMYDTIFEWTPAGSANLYYIVHYFYQNLTLNQWHSPSVRQPVNQSTNESIEILKNDDVDGGQSVFEITDLLQSRTMSQWCFIQRNTSQKARKLQMKGMTQKHQSAKSSNGADFLPSNV